MITRRGVSVTLGVLAALALLAACDGGTTAAKADAAAASNPDVASGADAKTDPKPVDLKSDPEAGLPTGATARYDMAGSDWHAQPFPTNVRRHADGAIDLSGFPPPREGDMPGILQEYLDYAKTNLSGWSLQPTFYVEFDAPLDPASVVLPADTVGTDHYFLMDVDPASPAYGKTIPLRASVSGPKRAQHLHANLFMAQPVWGTPLRPLTTYAFVLRRNLHDAAGKVLGRPKVLGDVLDRLQGGVAPAGDVTEVALQESLKPLTAMIAAGKLPVPYKDIAAAAVITTGNPTGELVGMAKWVREQAQTEEATNWVKGNANDPNFDLYTASYKAPNFQVGDCPYDDDGSGGFAFDAKGNPLVQHTEDLRVAVAVPKDIHLAKDGKLPVSLSAHGTGGDYLSFASGGKFKISTELTSRGIAIISIDQPMHGPRCNPQITGAVLDLKTFNFLNIAAGRSGFRQSALDTVFLARMVHEGKLNVPATVSADGMAVQFDPNRVTFIGHSQGGLSGALAAGIEPSFKAFVLSGAGAGLSLTIMLRKYPADISHTLTTVLGLDDGELSEFHPAISLVQALSDATDPLSYAALAFQRDEGVRPPHLLLTEGLLDQDTPSATAEALASALGLGVLAPMVHLCEAMTTGKTPVLTGPVTDNLTRGKFTFTGVVSQWANFDHFVIFDSGDTAKLYAEFLTTASDSGEATAVLP